MRWVLYMSLRTEFSELNRELLHVRIEYSVSGVVPSERQSLDPIELLLWIGPNYWPLARSLQVEHWHVTDTGVLWH